MDLCLVRPCVHSTLGPNRCAAKAFDCKQTADPNCACLMQQMNRTLQASWWRDSILVQENDNKDEQMLFISSTGVLYSEPLILFKCSGCTLLSFVASLALFLPKTAKDELTVIVITKSLFFMFVLNINTPLHNKVSY